MDRIRIFISSVQSEFAEERVLLYNYIRQDALLGQIFEPFIFEFAEAKSQTVSKVINKVTKDISKATDVNTQISDTVREQVNTQVTKLLLYLNVEGHTTLEISTLLNLKDRIGVMHNYIQPALKLGLIAMTIPDKPNSRLQKYRLTSKGKEMKEKSTLKIGKEQ